MASTVEEKPKVEVSAAAAAGTGESVDYYFDSYSHYGIHMEMLKDYHRTSSYRDAIIRNRHMFKGKIVLDVGCGTGILSMFAAKAGAKKVIGIDCSSVAKQASEIVALNGFGPKSSSAVAENKDKDGNEEEAAPHCEIIILKGKVEELDLKKEAGVDHVDIIISEWMGYFLLYESMLNTVLYARDKWGVKPTNAELSDGVKLFPSHANMYMCAINDPQYVENKFDVWDNVQGLDFSYFKRLSYIEPLVDTVVPNQIVSSTARLYSFDCATVTEEELSFERDVVMTCQRHDVVHAFSVHFDTPFYAGHDKVVLDTSPQNNPTHWRQTVLYLYNPLVVKQGEQIKCRLSCKPNSGNPRDLDISVHVEFNGKLQESTFDQDYRLR